MHIFSDGGLAVSVASAVWVGVMVVCLLNLRLGWALSGLVVPGFLAPLFITRPVVGFLSIFEGVFAYALVKLIAEVGSAKRKLDDFVGRDRFFLLVVAAVLTRIIFDGYLFGFIAEHLQSTFNYQIDYQYYFNSYGLIVVALIGNLFWKEGLFEEIPRFAVLIAITYILIRYGLMEFTNFKISQIELLYTQIDEIFSATPKLYIILLVTTLIATRMTFIFGWDYGGILIAGLLALQWYNPTRIVMTVVEAYVIYVVAGSLANTRFLEKYNIIGARKILVFFNIGFIYKLLLGYFVSIIFPEERVIEFYGYGYLLSTLIALQMHDTGSPLRVSTMLLGTSIAGVTIGTVIAVILAFATGGYSEEPRQATPIAERELEYGKEISHTQGYFPDFMNNYLVKALDIAKLPFNPPNVDDLYYLDHHLVAPLVKVVAKSKQLSDSAIEDELVMLNGYAALYGYQITLFDDLSSGDKMVLLFPNGEVDKTLNWGTYIFRLRAEVDQVIEVPRAFDEFNTLDFGVFLFENIKNNYLIIAGNNSQLRKNRSADLININSKQTLYNLFSQVLLRDHIYPNSVIQLRGYRISISSIAQPDKDIMVAFSDGAIDEAKLNSQQIRVLELIKQLGFGYQIVQEDEDTAGYGIGPLFLSRYTAQTSNHNLSVLWVSSPLRANFKDPIINSLLLGHFNTLGVATVTDSLSDYLQNHPRIQWTPSDDLRHLVAHYISTNDVVALKNILRTSYHFEHLVLKDDGRDYLAVLDTKNGCLLAIISLSTDAVVDHDHVIELHDKVSSQPNLSITRWTIFKEQKSNEPK